MPDPITIHVSQPLTDFSVAHFMEPDAYVARRAALPVNVPKQIDKYFVYSRADLLSTYAQKRAPGTAAAIRDFNLTTASYYIPVNAVAAAISEQDKANADAAINLEEDFVKVLIQDIKIAEEVAFAAVAFTTSGWGTNGAPTVTWENAASYPLTDITTAIRTVQANTGRMPNCLLLGAETYYSGLLLHPDIVERLPDNAPRIITRGFLATLLGFDEVLVATAGYNSAIEGATASYASILGDNALIFYRNPSPGRMSPTAMSTFVWSGLAGMQSGLRVQREDIPHVDALPLITVESAAAVKIISTELGYNFYTCIT